MPASFIRVTCGHCGKVLRVSESHAGKTGRCPNCRGSIKLPTLEDFRREQPASPEGEGRSCPTCGAYLNPGDAICISCYTNLATGEWDLEKAGYKKEKEATYPILKIAGLVLVALVVFMLGGYLAQQQQPRQRQRRRTNHKPASHNTTIHPVVKPPTTAEAAQVEQELQRLAQLPEQTQEQVHQKQEAYQAFLTKNTNTQLEFAYRILQELRQIEFNLSVKERFGEIEQALNTENIYKSWAMLANFPAKFHDAPEMQKIQEEKKQCCAKILADLNQKKEAAQQLCEQGKAAQGFLKLVPDILEHINELIIYQEFKPQLQGIIEVCWKAQSNALEEIEKDPETIRQENQEQLLKLQEDFELYLPFYLDTVNKRHDYEKARKKLEEYKAAVMRLTGNQPEDNPVYQRCVRLLEDLGQIQLLIDAAGQTILRNKGSWQTFLQKNNKLVRGKIGGFENGKIWVMANNKVEIVKLVDLRPEALVAYALKARQDAEIHLAAAFFAMYEGNFKLARREADRAKQAGINYKAYLYIQDRIKHAREEVAKLQNRTREKLREEYARRQELLRHKTLESNLKEARKILHWIMPYYQKGKFIEVFQCLARLKARMGAFPKELAKLNGEFKRHHGMDLGTVAEKCRTTCTVCRNKGTRPCTRCYTTAWVDSMAGPGPKGKIQVPIGKWSTHQKRTKVWILCPMCHGHKYITCSACAARRHSRLYKSLESYFKSIGTGEADSSGGDSSSSQNQQE